MFKKILAFSLAAMLGIGCVSAAYAAENTAKLYDIYGDNMLFRQSKEAVISGTAPSGSTVTAELHDKSNNLIASGTSKAADGIFTVSFIAPSGGYDEYSIVLRCNDSEFATLNNVVFGELWLASGQSNMMYPLAQAKYGRDMAANSEKLSRNIRALTIPAYPEYKGSTELLPVDPQQNITGAKWITGEDSEIYGVSAVAYYFANEMTKELDMPVGILNVSLGGTTIASWLSREAIDSNSKVKNYLKDNERYIEKSDWKEDGQNVYHDMTTNFNQRIAPLKNFRPAGMIWYQGESDLMFNFSSEYYSDAMKLMQSYYADYFDYDGDMLPAIYTQIAAYPYSDSITEPALWNIGYSEMQMQNADTQAMVTIYDLPTTFLPEVGVIHPENKKEIGERMAFAAKGLVYGKKDTFTAATVKSAESKDGSIYVTLQNVGSGLKANGNRLYGFAVCGEDGIYVQADAEIISTDTVRVWSKYVSSPRSASYACCLSNIRSNLFATENGVLALPVSPFITDSSVSTHYWADKPWTDCENGQIWHNVDDTFSKYYDSWSADGASIAFSDCMNITAEKKSFSVKPVLYYKDGIKNVLFRDDDSDYSDYGKISLKVRNNGTNEAALDSIRIYKNAVSWYTPAVDGSAETGTAILADGEWHSITFDLNSLYLYGNECGITYPNDKLGEVSDIELSFTGENADISIDEIRFAPSSESVGIRFDASIKNADNIGEFLSAIVIGFIGLIADLFI